VIVAQQGDQLVAIKTVAKLDVVGRQSAEHQRALAQFDYIRVLGSVIGVI
jgi:hypothetical protein